MVTIKDVAKKAEVSTALVSRYLNTGKGVSSASAERIDAAIKELEYSPNGIARSLVLQKTMCIGVVLDNICVPFLAPLIAGLQQGAEAFDPNGKYNLLFCSCNGELERKKRHVEYFTQGRVDGIIIYGSMTSDDTIIEKLKRQNFPFILIENDIEDVEADKVLIDNIDGAYQMTKYLIDLGKRRIAHIAWDPTSRVSKDRYMGYQRALKDNKIHLDFDLVVFPSVEEFNGETDLQGGKIHFDAGYIAVKNLLKRGTPVDAIFFAGDLMAFGGQKALQEVGIKIPSQISIAGFDDELPGYYNLTGTPVTTMRQPLREAGYLGVKALIKRLEEPETPTQTIKLKTKLIKRDSCISNL